VGNFVALLTLNKTGAPIDRRLFNSVDPAWTRTVQRTPTHASSLLPLSENHIPIILVSLGNRLLTFATAIAGGYGGGGLAAFGLGWLRAWNALLFRCGLSFWCEVGFDFL
jgi:hypothetical protein